MPAAWSHPGATAETRKRILRAILEKIGVKLEDGHIGLLLHCGGDHTPLRVPSKRPSWLKRRGT